MSLSENISNRFIIGILFTMVFKILMAEAKEDQAVARSVCDPTRVTHVTNWRYNLEK